MEQRNEYSEEYIKAWESYLYPGTEVLKNKLGIRDSNKLAQKEAEITFEKLVELYEQPIPGKFDIEHLKDIHRYLFGEIYDWAGEFRILYMRKNGTYFASAQNIELDLTHDLALLNREVLECTNKYDLADFLARNYINLQHIHPFREGNSRTLREFFREFVLEKTPLLSTGPMELDLEKMDRKVMAKARQFITRSFPGEIVMEFQKALVPIKLEEDITFKQ